MTLAEFVLARIAEDEAGAKAATPGPWYWEEPSRVSYPSMDESLLSRGQKARRAESAGGGETDDDAPVLVGWGYDASGIDGRQEDRDHIARHDPARVLRQCEAFRRIVDEWREAKAQADDGDMSGKVALFAFELGLRHLASIWADHPDYRQEWAA